jgi:hypothetical protein
MASYVNKRVSLGVSDSEEVQLNRWSHGDISIQVISGTISANGTLSQINRGETATWSGLSDQDGVAIAAVSTGIYNVQSGAYEAVQLTTGSTGSAEAIVMQQGDD